MIQVGGHAATLLDFEIPARHGLRQTIADTLGIGGVFRALRTIPVMLGIGRDMAELCPDAWLLNYTNPMAMLCQAYAHGSPHTKIVGLCHSIQHTTRQLAEYVDVPFEDVTFLGAGGYIIKPRGEVHAMWNAGSTPARMIEVISPAGLRRFLP
jgi:alpha-galactosidase